MGRQAFPIIGGIIGAVVVGFVTDGEATAQGYEAGFAIGAALGGIAGSYIDPILIQGNRVGDNNIQVAAEGGARAIIFGQACVTNTCVVARGNRVVTKKKSSNGKGSSGATQNESVSWTFAIGLGEAIPNSIVTRIWQDENLVYDITSSTTMSDSDNAAYAKKFRMYKGDEDQLPDADLQVFLGSDTPYFRGTSYVVFPNFDLTQQAERIPIFKFEVVTYPDELDALNGLHVEMDGYSFQIPHTASVTMAGLAPGVDYIVDLFFHAHMETRQYATVQARPGTNPRFVSILNTDASDSPADNIFTVQVDDPPQLFGLNDRQFGDIAGVTAVNLDGVTSLPIVVRNGSVVSIHCDPVDGLQGLDGSQYATILNNQLHGYRAGASSPIALSGIVSSLMLRAGMNAEQFDVTALDDDMIAGVCIQDTVVGVDAINSCVQPFFVDPTEVEGVLTFVKRGAPVVRTLTIDDLTEEPDLPSRDNVIEYPAKLSFFYQSPATGYASTKATSYRYSPQADSSGEGSVTAPITFGDPNEPQQIAQRLHKIMWTEADGSFGWTVGPHCIDLVGTDVVGLYLRGIATRARITAVENDGTSIKLTMVKDRQSNYVDVAQLTTIPLPLPTPPQPTTMSDTVLAVLDIPALQDTDDSLLYYTAMSGSTATWKGGELQRSLDGGSTWSAIGEVAVDVTMGRLTAVLPAAGRGYPDTTNTVAVKLFDPANDLLSYSDVLFHQEQGAVAIQLDDGTWEILQYRDATDGGSGNWTLSTLQRGRRDTVAGSHSVGALFVVLGTDLARNAAQTAWLGASMQHRAVSYGNSPESAAVVTQTFAGLSQREWAPASAVAEFDGATLYLHDIIARPRLGTEVNPIESVNFQGWVVTLTDGTTTVTANVVGDSAHVSAAPLTTVTSVSVAGLNKLTGVGEALTLVPTVVAPSTLTPEAILNAGGD